MLQWFMDVIVPPSVSDMMTKLVLHNFGIMVLILIALLILAAVIVNVCVLKNNRKTSKEEKQSDTEDKTWL